MKKNIFAKGMMAVLAASALTSCSSDYLEIPPITYLDETKVLSTTDEAQRAVWGVCRSMYFGYTVATTIQFMNGEAFINTLYGETFAQDAFYYLWTDYGGDFMNGNYLRQKNYWMPQMPWMYSYNIIAQCNKILDYIDNAAGSQVDRDYVKAQALTLRAHAYVKLLQFYAPRWEDSNNGDTYCIVLRKDYSTDPNADLSTMNQVIDLVYGDLDTAIKLFDGSSATHTRKYFEPDEAIAAGIKARCALIKHDWKTAQEMAAQARKDYPIMSADDYKAGFATPTSEWMWASEYSEYDEYIGYIGWASQYGCNGEYVNTWGYGAGAINYDLYKQMDANDTRRDLYWTPDKAPRPFITPAHFWNSDYVESRSMNMNTTTSGGSPSVVSNFLKTYANSMLPNKDISKFFYQAYRHSNDPEANLFGIVPFGAQFKFWGIGELRNANYCYMRGSEMALIEAEAAYMQGDETTAKQVLTELNSQRITGYTCSTSGQALLDEIRLSRRIELWGEGFCWTDLKRWNLPSVRRAWKQNDVNSGNIPAAYAETVEPTDINGWRIIIPDAEVDYNDLINKFAGKY